ncbi:MAG: glutathione S-transferase [Burkholderiaceae bacterium]
MITLHHLENSRSQRILWLLEEMGLEYQVKSYQRDPGSSLAPKSLEAIHPLGKSPVITDGDITIAESGAIIEYLLETYDQGQLLPRAGSLEKRRYTYWLHYAEGSFMPLMVFSLIMSRIETAPMPFFVKPIARGIVGKVRSSYLNPNISRHLLFMEAALTEHEWFCGPRITGADIQMSFPVLAARSRTGMAVEFPRLNAFLDAIETRPGYQAALKRGGPFKLPGLN